MDATTGIIVFMFVASILTSIGGKNTSVPTFPTESINKETSVKVPASLYTNVSDEAVLPTQQLLVTLQTYIAKYRSQEEAQSIAGSIVHYSSQYDINPKLVTALIARESRFNPRALSSSGAVGLGQLLPSTAKGLNIENAYDIDQNVRGTVRYLKSMLDRFSGKIPNAIAAYLEGPNSVDRQGGFSNSSKAYVEDILSIYQKL